MHYLRLLCIHRTDVRPGRSGDGRANGSIFGIYVIALAFGLLILVQLWPAWKWYWLLTDGREGTAIVTEEHSRGVVSYKYAVGPAEYGGRCSRISKGENHRNARVGDRSPVYYSASRPGLSDLKKPGIVPDNLPFLTFICLLESGVVMTAVARRRRRHG